MKLYIGNRDFKPEGYITVDVDPRHNPDILADASELTSVSSETFDEVIAGAVLEHIPWPRSYQALSEWVRVLKPGGILKVSVPDMRLLCSMVARGVDVFHAIGMIYGTGRINNVFEAHQYGYTREMLVQMYTVLGLGEVNFWSSALPDAANGWVWGEAGEQFALSLNLMGKKIRQPAVDTAKLVRALSGQGTLKPFMSIVRDVAGADVYLPPTDPEIDTLLFQYLHYQLLSANQRIRYLEDRTLSSKMSYVRRILLKWLRTK